MSVEVIAAEGAFRGKVFIAGYHGFGLVGYLTVRHIIGALGGRKVGYVISPHMPQIVNMGPDGLVAPYELYDVGPAVVFLPNVPLPRGDMIRVPYKLAEASISGGSRAALLIGGLDASYRRGDSALRYAATRPFLRQYGELVRGLVPLEEGLSVVGPLAAMLAYYEAHDFPSVAILPYADPSSADPLAAKAAVEFVAQALGVTIDTSELVRLAEEKVRLERKVEELRKRMREEGGRIPSFYV